MRELLVAQTLFEPDPPASILLVHGPPGIGKSALLREIARCRTTVRPCW